MLQDQDFARQETRPVADYAEDWPRANSGLGSSPLKSQTTKLFRFVDPKKEKFTSQQKEEAAQQAEKAQDRLARTK